MATKRTETGLSLDDRPVNPILATDGRWICPVDGKEVLRCRDGSWTHRPSQAFLELFGITLEEHLASDF